MCIRDSIKTDSEKKSGGWLIYAVLSAVFASLTSILGKIGIEGIDSNLGTAIRTTVVPVSYTHLTKLLAFWKSIYLRKE